MTSPFTLSPAQILGSNILGQCNIIYWGLIIVQDALTGEDSSDPASHHPNSTVSGGISGLGREIGRGGGGGRGGGRGRGENGRREGEGRGDEGGRGGETTRVMHILKGKCLGK